VGSGQVARFNGLLALRAQLLDVLAEFPLPVVPGGGQVVPGGGQVVPSGTQVPGGTQAVPTAATDPNAAPSVKPKALPGPESREVLEALATRVQQLRHQAQQTLSTSYAGITLPEAWTTFVEGQFQRLERAVKQKKDVRATLETVVLGLSAALDSLANSDSRTVSKQLGDVAEEMAFAARQAQQAEGRQDAVFRLDLAISVLRKGAGDLRQLGILGADIGSVAMADLGRVQRSRERDDFFHAELAALHMAERLHRPNPSFGSKGGGGGGVESGSGASGGGQSDAKGKPSEAADEFQRRAHDLEQLAQEHGDLAERTAGAMHNARDAARGADSEEAKQRASALREAVVRLPQPGENPGTGRASAALAREHAGAMAHELEQQRFEEALKNGRRAQSAAEEALADPNLDDFTRAELERAKQQLTEQLAWTQQQADRLKQLTEGAAKEALSEFAKLERELSERASRLSADDLKDASLPAQLRQRLEEASRLMQEAGQRLQEGKGDEAIDKQSEAQRLLEESDTGQMQEPESQGDAQDNEDGEGRKMRTGGDVPNADRKNRAEEFRRRVLEGLGEQSGARLSPAVKRYAEGLLR
jgi:hypothetical protein